MSEKYLIGIDVGTSGCKIIAVDEGRVVVDICGINSLKEELQQAIRPMLQVFKDVSVNTPNVEFNIIS